MRNIWLITYENNVGVVGGFSEWWTISNTSEPIRVFTCNNVDDAQWLHDTLVAHRSAEVAKCV